jgi:hypothetical protein
MEDLFDDIESLPLEVQNVLEEFSHKDQTYENCQQLIAALEPLGYTCDYDLSGTPFGFTNHNL